METHILAGIISSLIASILSLIFLIINFLRSTRTIIEQSEKKNFDHLVETISRHVYNSKDLLASHEDHLVSRKIQSEPLLETCNKNNENSDLKINNFLSQKERKTLIKNLKTVILQDGIVKLINFNQIIIAFILANTVIWSCVIFEEFRLKISS